MRPRLITWRAAIGSYAHTRGLLSGEVVSPRLTLAFDTVTPIHRAFAPMVREARWDVCEMAIATYLQARAWGKPLVVLPVALAARHQQSALLCLRDGPIARPGDLAGRRVGVRAYSQTTGMWLRGILGEGVGGEAAILASDMRWITFEAAHVAEAQDPPWAERAPAGYKLMDMLHGGELDAVIVGNDVPDDAALRTVFADPEGAGAAFVRAHGFVPVNHVLTVRSELARERPDLAGELVDMMARSGATTGRNAVQPALDLAQRYMMEQGMLPRPLDAGEVWGAP